MTAATIAKPQAPATAAAKRGARVVPEGQSTATAAAATRAGDALDLILSASKSRVAALIEDKYGKESDDKRDPLAAVRLAKRAAAEASGASKSRGGARADVLAVLDSLAKYSGAPVTDVTFVLCARARLDSLAAAKRERTARKQALADKVNDHTAPLATRAAALEVLSEMDDQDATAKRDALAKRVQDALIAAAKAGIGGAEIHALWHSALMLSGRAAEVPSGE